MEMMYVADARSAEFVLHLAHGAKHVDHLGRFFVERGVGDSKGRRLNSSRCRPASSSLPMSTPVVMVSTVRVWVSESSRKSK